MQIDINGVTVSPCETDCGEYVVEFYGKDVDRDEVRSTIHDQGYSISHRETAEGGELVTLFVERE